MSSIIEGRKHSPIRPISSSPVVDKIKERAPREWLARSTRDHHGARTGLSNGVPLPQPREDLSGCYRRPRPPFQSGTYGSLHRPVPPQLLRLVVLHLVRLTRHALGGGLGVAGIHVLFFVRQ
jgi:hypothetical protein